MTLKDDYREICRALGFKGDAWFGDPLVKRSEIVAKAKELVVGVVAERQQVKDTIKKLYQSANEDHSNGFHDGEQDCDCYYVALNDLLAELN